MDRSVLCFWKAFMNDRIKQLAGQAGIYIVPEPFDDHSRAWNDTMGKFAELIVEECMKLNSKELSITAIERLLPLYEEHFGVKL